MEKMKKTKMKKTLETIVEQLNPKQDLESVKFHDQLGALLSEQLNVGIYNIINLIAPLPKHGIRGAILGVGAGMFLGVFNNNNFRHYILGMMGAGLSVDILQYTLRAGYEYAKVQIYGDGS